MLVSVGRQLTLYNLDSGIRTFPLSQEEGSIPVYVVSNSSSVFAVAIEIVCRRTPRKEMDWQINTHAAIQSAYLAAKARFEKDIEQQAIRNPQSGGLGNANPGLNREIERNELKKHCISILSQQHYDIFNSIETGGEDIPQLNLAVAGDQGAYIRFFEQAFEWSLMNYLLYPYFWSRKSTWIDRIRYNNNDPQYAEFIQAGSARAVLPVRPGFEGAVEHFMRTGEPWNGGPMPEITDDDYLPFVEEMRSRTDRLDETLVQ